MRELDDTGVFMIALGGWMAGTGTTLIFTEIQSENLVDPILSGIAFGVSGTVIILSELYIGRLRKQ